MATTTATAAAGRRMEFTLWKKKKEIDYMSELQLMVSPKIPAPYQPQRNTST